ncbi:sugar ABC transporter permease [Actinoplanes sp. TBRC 11911]|uniref:carbohydrate ABC transporter permease n=1 Tax=Actinoplanes sp. TBRC 11911 TaxID=2729386 RepID=UPI00145D83EB|nr:sugar ABC transporter permease [Actinoplanes sp. TBRC 11911]NMO54047.1 sugar ABC transporter permease [Actinoplanes sp. TBRC 11911]
MTQTTAPVPVATEVERAPRARAGRVRRLTGSDRLVLGLMVGVPTLIQAVLIWIPTLLSIGLSVTRWNGLALSGIKPVGLDNYRYALRDYPPFWPAIAHNVIWLGFLALVATPLGVLLAVVLDQQIRFTRLYQSVFFTPVMLSLVLVGIVWQLVYARNEGLLNNLLGTAGTNGAVDWLGDPHVNLWAALIATGWRHAGYIMVLYLAGLKGLDPSLREAASIDGATGRQTLFRVVFPAMRQINILVVVITFIEALRAFDIVWVINHGTNGLELLSVLVIQNLVGEGQVIGVGSALAVLLLIVSLIPIVIYLVRTFRKAD